MIADSLVDLIGKTPIVRLGRLFPDTDFEVLAKLDLLNPMGSAKDRVVHHIVDTSLRSGLITTSTVLVESSSGNFAIALATVARLRGLRAICVIDPHTTTENTAILNALEAEVRIADNPDDYGGYLHSRLQLVRQIVAEMPDAMWINQYDNPKNWQAHSEGTAVEILNDIDEPVDCLVVAVSTTGTIMGLVSTLRAAWPAVRVVGRDRRRPRSTRARTAPTLSGAHPLPRSWRALPEHGLQSRVAAGDGI